MRSLGRALSNMTVSLEKDIWTPGHRGEAVGRAVRTGGRGGRVLGTRVGVGGLVAWLLRDPIPMPSFGRTWASTALATGRCGWEGPGSAPPACLPLPSRQQTSRVLRPPLTLSQGYF